MGEWNTEKRKEGALIIYYSGGLEGRSNSPSLADLPIQICSDADIEAYTYFGILFWRQTLQKTIKNNSFSRLWGSRGLPREVPRASQERLPRGFCLICVGEHSRPAPDPRQSRPWPALNARPGLFLDFVFFYGRAWVCGMASPRRQTVHHMCNHWYDTGIVVFK